MSRKTRHLLWPFVSAVLLIVPTASAESDPVSQPTTRQQVTPIQDDANLNDVCFVGSKIGWAVGDHGVIWHTTDGGRNWVLQKSPVRCPLRSVCCLTDRVGWIVGGGTAPSTRLGYGVVLFTDDGGKTWRQLVQDLLPQLHSVKFFSMREGVAVGAASSQYSTGVFVTRDGGATWRSIPGRRTAGWRAADFLRLEVGVVAGPSGRVSRVGGGRLLPPRLEPLGLRGLRSATLANDATGWLVGDGGLVLRTTDGGVSWPAPPTPLPKGLRDIVDFRAVAAWGEKVWIAGQPGSVVWHTADGGRTWQRQFTRQTVPINAIRFTSETAGWAAGALGMLLRTDDGGETWKPVRGGGRRCALMALHARPGRVSLHLLAKQSRELGYRSVVWLPARRDVGPDGQAELDLDVRLHEAVTAAGGSAGEIDWRFPIDIPGIEQNREKLEAEWNRRTEGRLGDVFLGKLVCQLRTWRPSVVVIDEPSADDALANLLDDALLHAVRQAADSTRFVPQQELTGLEPWQVQKVYRRLPAGSTGQTHVELHELLPRVGPSVQIAAADAYARLLPAPPRSSLREAYRLDVEKTPSEYSNLSGADFFTGIPLPPGSAARRKLADFDERQYELRKKIVQRQRNFRAVAERLLDDPRHAAQVIAELSQITQGMPDEQAAWGLIQLADDYRRRRQWDLVEATLVDLVERYPDQPVTLSAMRWLFQFWAGAEPAWQRVRAVKVSGRRLSVNANSVLRRVEQATHLVEVNPGGRDEMPLELGPDPLELISGSGELKVNDNAEWRHGAVRHWHEQALRMASLIRKKSPALYRTAEVQFPLAALLRARGVHRLADKLYRRYDRAGQGDPWRRTAESELWLITPGGQPPKPMAICQSTSEPPVLDGVLSDTCWQNANEIRLRAAAQNDEGENATDYAFAMLAYDSEYFYLAASVLRTDGIRKDKPQLAGRTHDADLSKFDRIGLFLDTDRDYATYYTLHVDQRGWTAESCWEDTSWNPTWYVAADDDEMHWRIEVAIPMKELAPATPPRGSVWAVGIVRTIPAVGLESWPSPAGSRPRPETFGLLRFD